MKLSSEKRTNFQTKLNTPFFIFSAKAQHITLCARVQHTKGLKITSSKCSLRIQDKINIRINAELPPIRKRQRDGRWPDGQLGSKVVNQRQ